MRKKEFNFFTWTDIHVGIKNLTKFIYFSVISINPATPAPCPFLQGLGDSA